jgi:ubiquinone biosynthesis monooxygenase Coq7
MPGTFRQYSPVDRLLSLIDQGLKLAIGADDAGPAGARPSPAAAATAAGPAAGTAAARHSAGLMRVNHAGEVAAQALYQGQALVARDPEVREFLLAAAREEGDHLSWCRERLRALGSQPSRLGPLWYLGGLGIGALAGLAGDRLSLAFITETERQVEGHLDEHLARLPAEDTPSRAVLEQMQRDEVVHGARARERGGGELAAPVRALMRLTAKLMTTSAYWI